MPSRSAIGSPPALHVWKFARAGGLDQVRFETSDDFLDIENLDQKLWVALSCPTRGLHFDERTLALVDADGDGRIRAPDLIAAVRWACQHLKDPGTLALGSASLPLESINTATESGARILAAARRVLQAVGKPASPVITAEDLDSPAKIVGQLEFDGDGVLSPSTVRSDPELVRVFDEIIATMGAVRALDGRDGVDGTAVTRFFDQLKAFEAWTVQGEQLALPVGAETPAAFAALQSVRTKVADYFARCQLAAFDPRATIPLNRAESEFIALAAQDLSQPGTTVAALPLARIEAGRSLPLVEGVNPAWAGLLEVFRRLVVAPIFGSDRTTLSESAWLVVLDGFAAYESHLAARPAAAVGKLGVARIRELLSGTTRARLEALIQQDLAIAPEIAAIDSVARLVRYHRDLGALLNNFVSFRDFYSADRWAPFQAGTLYVDGRSCDLCVQVEDPAGHAVIAARSNLCIVYCACRRRDGAAMTIAACVTQGDSDYLMPGRNGVFYDRQGRDWDASIVKVLDNPISLRQAFWLPYKKLARFIEEQAARFAAAKEKTADTQLAGSAAAAAESTPGTGKTAAFDIGKFAGIFAAIGLALGYIGGAISAIVLGFFHLAPWQMPLALAGALLLVSGPSLLLVWLKLRQRTLGPVLDGIGWAINGHIRINVPLGAALTREARLPANAQRMMVDPYEDKAAARRNRRIAVIVSLLLLVTLLWITLVHERQPATGIMAPGSAASSEPPGPGTVNSPSAPKQATP
jgi:hypothetical protein